MAGQMRRIGRPDLAALIRSLDDENARALAWIASPARFTHCMHGVPYRDECADCGERPF